MATGVSVFVQMPPSRRARLLAAANETPMQIRVLVDLELAGKLVSGCPDAHAQLRRMLSRIGDWRDPFVAKVPANVTASLVDDSCESFSGLFEAREEDVPAGPGLQNDLQRVVERMLQQHENMAA